MPPKKNNKGGDHFKNGFCKYTQEECPRGFKCLYDRHSTRCEFTIDKCPHKDECEHRLHMTICKYAAGECDYGSECMHQIHLSPEEMKERKEKIKLEKQKKKDVPSDTTSEFDVAVVEPVAAKSTDFVESPKFLAAVKDFLLMNMRKDEKALMKNKSLSEFNQDNVRDAKETIKSTWEEADESDDE